MDRWRGRKALVTGASSGIGYAIAEALARNGVVVFACARRKNRLEELAERMSTDRNLIVPIQCDLTQEDDILRMFELIENQYGHLDILVNNAGVGHADDLISGRTEKWREVINLNVLALSICTREALRLMNKNGIDDGHIVNINSGLSHYVNPSPITHMYGSSKHMTLALTKALNAELRQQKSKIRVSSISPGMVATEFDDVRVASADPTDTGGQVFLNHVTNYVKQLKQLDPKDVADAVLYVLGCPAHVNIRELSIWPVDQSETSIATLRADNPGRQLGKPPYRHLVQGGL